MSTNKHTPGPWATYQLADGSWPIRAEDGYLVAVVPASAYEARAEANARLIAASPTMVEALEQIASGYLPDHIEMTREDMQQIAEAALESEKV